MLRINLGEVNLYYDVHGHGGPLVLIPGFRTGLWLWFKQVDAFALKFRTIIFDPRGIDASDYAEPQEVNAPLTTKTIADDIAP